MEDQTIIALYWQRDEAALDETAKKYGGYCHAVAYNILGCGMDAEECVNDTWLHAWHAIPPQRPLFLGAFLSRITRNLCLSRIRRLSAKKRGASQAELALSELDECIPARNKVEDELEARELAESINRFLAGLKESERNIFMARYYHFAPTADIARRTGSSVSKVNTTLSRTRAKLRKFLKEEELC